VRYSGETIFPIPKAGNGLQRQFRFTPQKTKEKEASENMGQRMHQTILFLCTGNYYRSRFAEVLFNSVAERMGLAWRADSRGLALERGVNNVGPMEVLAVEALQALGIEAAEACARLPAQVTAEDLEQAHRIIALHRDEHLPLVQERYPAWVDKVEFWQIDDSSGVLPRLEREVRELTAALLGQGSRVQGSG
jgi:protein-tyrosine phosphatase